MEDPSILKEVSFHFIAAYSFCHYLQPLSTPRWLAASSALLPIVLLPGELPHTVGQKNGSLVSESSTIFSLSCPEDLYAHTSASIQYFWTKRVSKSSPVHPPLSDPDSLSRLHV